MTPAELADKMDRIAARMSPDLEQAQEQIGAEAVKIGQFWSSGGRSLVQLRADDHPYATRHGQYTGSALVNRQGGTFFSGWYYDAARKALVNPHGSRLQEGTPTMVARDILGAIERDLQPIKRREIRAAIKRSMKA